MHYIALAHLHTFFTAYRDSDFFGKLIFLGLFSISILSWCVLLHKVWVVKKVQKLQSEFQKKIMDQKSSLLQLDLSKASELQHPFQEIFGSIQQKTTEILRKNHFFAKDQETYLSNEDLELIESHVLTTISYQIKSLEKNVFLLTTITTLGPFLGLLGTVWGILITFSGLQGGTSVTSNASVLSGLSTALTTTVLGLLIAIPALIGYNYIKNSIKTLSSDMEDFLYTVLSQVELEYRRVDRG